MERRRGPRDTRVALRRCEGLQVLLCTNSSRPTSGFSGHWRFLIMPLRDCMPVKVWSPKGGITNSGPHVAVDARCENR